MEYGLCFSVVGLTSLCPHTSEALLEFAGLMEVISPSLPSFIDSNVLCSAFSLYACGRWVLSMRVFFICQTIRKSCLNSFPLLLILLISVGWGVRRFLKQSQNYDVNYACSSVVLCPVVPVLSFLATKCSSPLLECMVVGCCLVACYCVL